MQRRPARSRFGVPSNYKVECSVYNSVNATASAKDGLEVRSDKRVATRAAKKHDRILAIFHVPVPSYFKMK